MSQLHHDPDGVGDPAFPAEVIGDPGNSGFQALSFVAVGDRFVVAYSGRGFSYVIDLNVSVAPPHRLLQRNDGYGPRGHARILTAGRNGATSGQYMTAGPRLGNRNTYDQ